MSIPWLASLPQCPLPYDENEELGSNAIEFAPDAETIPIRRQRSTFAPDMRQMSFRMTAAQAASFRAWFGDDLKGGAEAFYLALAGVPYDFWIMGRPTINRNGADSYMVAFQAKRVAQ